MIQTVDPTEKAPKAPNSTKSQPPNRSTVQITLRTSPSIRDHAVIDIERDVDSVPKRAKSDGDSDALLGPGEIRAVGCGGRGRTGCI